MMLRSVHKDAPANQHFPMLIRYVGEKKVWLVYMPKHIYSDRAFIVIHTKVNV